MLNRTTMMSGKGTGFFFSMLILVLLWISELKTPKLCLDYVTNPGLRFLNITTSRGWATKLEEISQVTKPQRLIVGVLQSSKPLDYKSGRQWISTFEQKN